MDLLSQLMMVNEEGETGLLLFCTVMGGMRPLSTSAVDHLTNENRTNLEQLRRSVDLLKVSIIGCLDREDDRLIQLLTMCNHRSESVLHYACKHNIPIEIISKLIEKGGRDLLFMKCTNNSNETALHYACKLGADSLEIVNALINVGGRELVMQKTHEGETALFHAIRSGAPMDVVSRLLDEGDDDLLFQTNTIGQTVLFVVAWSSTSFDTLRELITLGGKELVMAKSTSGFGVTVLDEICSDPDIPNDIISMLIDMGGKELILMTRGGPIVRRQHFVSNWIESVYMEDPDWRRLDNHIQKLALLFHKLVSPNGGDEEDMYEFAIGYLYGDFDSPYLEPEAWEEVWFPALQEVQQHHPNAPLLHAAIIHESKPFAIKDFTTKFDDSIMLVKDSHNRYPIDVAVEKGLQWENGMKEIFDKFTSIQKETVQNKLLVAIRHGVKWDQGIKYILEESKVHISKADKMTNLYPFMLAASGQKCDLDSVFNLTKANPHLIKQM